MTFCSGVLKFQDIITNNITLARQTSLGNLFSILRYEVPLFKHITTDGHTTKRSKATL